MGLVLQNGITIGSANMSVVIGGVIVTGIRSLDYKVTYNKENVAGFQAEPVARERKNKEYGPLTMEILLEEWKSIIAAAPNRDPFSVALFSIPIVYDNNVLPGETINNVEFREEGRTIKASDGSIWISVVCVFAGVTS